MKKFVFWFKFICVFSQGRNLQWSSIVSDHGLALYRRQAYIWNNDSLVTQYYDLAISLFFFWGRRYKVYCGGNVESVVRSTCHCRTNMIPCYIRPCFWNVRLKTQILLTVLRNMFVVISQHVHHHIESSRPRHRRHTQKSFLEWHKRLAMQSLFIPALIRNHISGYYSAINHSSSANNQIYVCIHSLKQNTCI